MTKFDYSTTVVLKMDQFGKKFCYQFLKFDSEKFRVLLTLKVAALLFSLDSHNGISAIAPGSLSKILEMYIRICLMTYINHNILNLPGCLVPFICAYCFK